MVIYLFDHYKLTGHHRLYLEALKNIDGTVNIDEKKYTPVKKSFFKNIIQRYFILKKALSKVKDGEIIHILYLDSLYILPIIKKLNKRKKIVGTLHHVPINFIKFFLLKNFSNKIDKIIVHSEFCKDILFKKGIKNVKVIEYPSFFDYSKYEDIEKIKTELGIDKNKIIITSLGGTRYDKGLDILLESFKYLDSEIKDKILLNIVGEIQYFKKEFIKKIGKENGIDMRSEFKFINDDEFCKNVLITDIMAMPYRKVFGGTSGPMTEAIVNKKLCVVPEELVIGKLTKKYNLGVVFQIESPKSLASAIEKSVKMIKRKEYISSDYYNCLTRINFINNHKILYKSFEEYSD